MIKPTYEELEAAYNESLCVMQMMMHAKVDDGCTCERGEDGVMHWCSATLRGAVVLEEGKRLGLDHTYGSFADNYRDQIESLFEYYKEERFRDKHAMLFIKFGTIGIFDDTAEEIAASKQEKDALVAKLIKLGEAEGVDAMNILTAYRYI